MSGAILVPSASPRDTQGWSGLRAGDRRPRRQWFVFLLRPARLVGFPPGACRGECHNLFVHTTPADRNVSLWRGALPEIREEASALRRSARRGGRERPCSKLLLAGDDGCPFQRNGGLVTTMLSREGRSLRMTFRMCRISSPRGAMARRPGHLATQPDAAPLLRADRSASSDSRGKLDARLADKGRAVE